MGGEDTVTGSHPAKRDHVVDLLHVPGAPLGALPAGGAAPDLLLLYLTEAEGGLPDQLAHAELPYPVPGADRIALSALVAELDGLSAFFSYLVYYLFKWG